MIRYRQGVNGVCRQRKAAILRCMRVQVLYFAIVRERLGRDQEIVELPDGATLATLLEGLAQRHPAIASLRRHMQVARNREAAPPHTLLCDGDEVALIPPVSGGAGRLAEVREAALDLTEVVRAVAGESAGAIVTFTGAVRRESRGKLVTRLEYEAYRAMADGKLAEICDGIEGLHPGARLAVLHRVGVLVVGELAVVIAASAPHRDEAFSAARLCIEQLKQEVPIWKKEISDDGEEWIGLGP